eukprot:g4049.t1
MSEVLDRAYASEHCDRSPTTLKIFLAPEFYWRGQKGAYRIGSSTFSAASKSAVEHLSGKVSHPQFKHWVVVPGTVVMVQHADERYVQMSGRPFENISGSVKSRGEDQVVSREHRLAHAQREERKQERRDQIHRARQVISFLRLHGFSDDVNRPKLSWCGLTSKFPLHQAITEHRWQMVAYLLEFGADEGQKDWRGRSLTSLLSQQPPAAQDMIRAALRQRSAEEFCKRHPHSNGCIYRRLDRSLLDRLGFEDFRELIGELVNNIEHRAAANESGGLRVGFEICLDHAMGQLCNKDLRPDETVDVQAPRDDEPARGCGSSGDEH